MLLADPCGRSLPPLERALATFSTRLSQTPWEVTDVDELRAAGLTEASILHVVVQCAYFNYLNRVADGVGIDFDYESPLPRLDKDPSREPFARTARPAVPPPVRLRLADRPTTHAAYTRWRAHLMDRDAPLTRRERRVVAAAAAAALGDASIVEAPAGAHEQALAEYATTLTTTPWRLSGESLAPLRARGLDDRALLDVITVASFQNAATRIGFVLGG